MAAGDVFNAKLTTTDTRATLDSLVGAGPKTYAYLRFKSIAGGVAIGNANVAQPNGFQLARLDELILNSGTVAGANINLVGAGTVEFFGITSA